MSLPARTAASARESVIRKSPGQNFKRWPKARVSLQSSFGGGRLRLFYLFPRKPVAIRDTRAGAHSGRDGGKFGSPPAACSVVTGRLKECRGHGCQGTMNVHPNTKPLVSFGIRPSNFGLPECIRK